MKTLNVQIHQVPLRLADRVRTRFGLMDLVPTEFHNRGIFAHEIDAARKRNGEIWGHETAEIEQWLRDCPADKLPAVMDRFSGKIHIPQSVKETRLAASRLGHLACYAYILRNSITPKPIAYEDTVWVNGELVAHGEAGSIDGDMTQKVIDRQLIWTVHNPCWAVTCKPGFQPVTGWSADEDPEDLSFPGELPTWSLKVIGGRTYFIFAEKGNAQIGCCRAQSIRTMVQQFTRYPLFWAEIKNNHKSLFTGIQDAAVQEGLCLP